MEEVVWSTLGFLASVLSWASGIIFIALPIIIIFGILYLIGLFLYLMIGPEVPHGVMEDDDEEARSFNEDTH
jgi:hypothetical protein